MTNLTSVLDRSAAAQPDRIAIRLDDLSVSYQQQSVRERVAYKHPLPVWQVDILPKGSTGKILRREVRVPEEPA